MPIKREFTRIPALGSAAQLLVALQVDGHLDGFEVPDWATGTSVEELLNAVRSLEDGEWLEGVYPDHGLLESADRWLESFMNGEEVPTQEDAEAIRAKRDAPAEDGGALGNASIERALMTYAGKVPLARRAAFAKKLTKAKFLDLARRCYFSLGLAVGALMVEETEAAIKAMEDKFTFLDPQCLKDPDLVAMMMTYLSDDFADTLDNFELSAAEIKRANKRAKAMVARIKAATEKPA
jgi:hypothetical protein